MDQKGQTFDVFKLLISAVIAIAILVILMNILGGIPGIGSDNPEKLAEDTVKGKLNAIGSPGFVSKVIFKKDDAISARSIALKSEALSEDQVCVTVSDSTPNKKSFEDTAPGKIITYTGEGQQQTRLMVLCDRESDIDETIKNYKYDTKLGLTMSRCTVSSSGSQKYCIVAVVSES